MPFLSLIVSLCWETLDAFLVLCKLCDQLLCHRTTPDTAHQDYTHVPPSMLTLHISRETGSGWRLPVVVTLSKEAVLFHPDSVPCCHCLVCVCKRFSGHEGRKLGAAEPRAVFSCVLFLGTWVHRFYTLKMLVWPRSLRQQL